MVSVWCISACEISAILNFQSSRSYFPNLPGNCLSITQAEKKNKSSLTIGNTSNSSGKLRTQTIGTMNNARGVRSKIFRSLYYLHPEVVIKYLIKLESRSCSAQLLDKYFRAIFLLNIWNGPASLAFHPRTRGEGFYKNTCGLSEVQVSEGEGWASRLLPPCPVLAAE